LRPSIRPEGRRQAVPRTLMGVWMRRNRPSGLLPIMRTG
jgi:hypothetical protein